MNAITELKPVENRAIAIARLDSLMVIANKWFSYSPESGVVSWAQKPNRNIRVGDKAGTTWIDPRGKTKYTRISVDGTQVFAHVVAVILMTGKHPVGDVDHVDGDGENNKWINLKNDSHTSNMRNQKRNKRNASGTMGVDFHVASNKWRARIIVDKKEQHLGTFDEKTHAEQARINAEKLFGFSVNHGRAS